MITGEVFAGLYMILIQPAYNRKLAANNNMPIPEWRLPPVIIGGASICYTLAHSSVLTDFQVSHLPLGNSGSHGPATRLRSTGLHQRLAVLHLASAS